MIDALAQTSLLSWPEWVLCGTVAVAALACRRTSRWPWIAGAAACVVALGVGTAGLLLVPVIAGAGVGGWLVCLSGRRTQIAGRAIAVGGAVLSAGACWVFPVPLPPPLPGPSAVGTRLWELPAEAGSPRLMVQCWYPASEVHDAPVAWLPDRALAPLFPYHRLAAAHSHAHQDAKPSGEIHGAPVLFYEHSWNGHRAENIAQVEGLASEGFVVVAIDHPGQARHVTYKDGTVIAARNPQDPELTTEAEVKEFLEDAETKMNQRVGEIARVREWLGSHREEGWGNLRISRCGIFGFSFGGTTALRVCAEDPAFVAAANEDGLHLVTSPSKRPVLFFDQEMPSWLLEKPTLGEYAGHKLTRQAEARIVQTLETAGSERFILPGTRHLSFSDRIHSSPLPRLARTGTCPPGEVYEKILQHLTGFFRRTLED